MATNRVYVVHESGKPVALVRASSQSAAIRHIVKNQYEAVPADQEMLIKHLPSMAVQEAGDDGKESSGPGLLRG